MARNKKIVIEGSNLLTSLSQPWGGVNDTLADITIHGTTVPPGYEWGINRGEIERFMKAEYGIKFGDFRTTQPDVQGFVHLLCFATEADAAQYDLDPTREDLIIKNLTIPISVLKEDSYVARLFTNRDDSRQYVVRDGSDFVVGVRFSAIHVVAATSEQENMNGNGSLVIERSTDNQGTWSRVATLSVPSSDVSSEDFPTQVNIGQYLTAGRDNFIRMRALYNYIGTDGEQYTMASGYIVFNIPSVTLEISMTTDWARPVMASAGAFPLAFAIYGAVDKWLHVTISGSLGTYTYVEPIAANVEYPSTSPRSWNEPEKSDIGILTHGVHTVTAWLSCDDGSGHTDGSGYPDGITSEVQVNRLMVVNPNTPGASLATPRIMLQGVKDVVANYVRTVIGEYAVWIPDPQDPTHESTERMPLSIRITDAGTGDTGYSTIYADIEQTGMDGVMNGEHYDIDTTIEIEQDGSIQPDTYPAYLRIFRYDGDSIVNILQDSIGQRYVNITVDNSEDYAPTANAYFYLNPRTRNNNEDNPRTIINAVTGQVVPSEFVGFGGVNDMWITADDGQKVFRVPAGARLVLHLDPWEEFIGGGASAIRSAMSLEIDLKSYNITQEDEPMIDITQEVDGETLGLRMMPLEGWIKSSERQNTNDQDFAWQEDVREHMVATVAPSVVTRSPDEMPWMHTMDDRASSPLALAKIYLNGSPEREVDYVLKANSWATGSGHDIVIGNPHCDIDIYGLKIYHFALSADQVRQNYIASLPTAAEKQAEKQRNDILVNGRIDYEKSKARTYRCLTWVGQDQYKVNQDKNTGYPGYWKIVHNNPALSGTIGKASYLAYVAGTLDGKKCLMITAQGSTANTYWENNGQTKLDKVTFVVNIPFSLVHEDFGWTAAKSSGEGCANPMYLDGSRIEGTEYASLTDAQKARVTIDVIDGWFDGNGWSAEPNECGMYHGTFYTCYVGGAKATKLVNKINYASPMQSHKMGATRIYHDVQMAVTGGMAMHRADPTIRMGVYEERFLYFTENPDNNYKPEFHGMCTFGQGKFDKVAFGYSRDKRTFAFEGLNNNLPLCDFRVPCDSDVTYSPDDEAWSYNGVKSFEYGLGKTQEINGQEYPTDENDVIFRRYVNIIYSHNPRLRYYDGTRAQFLAYYEQLKQDETKIQEVVDMQGWQYWFTSGFQLVRFDFVRDEWTDAGTWDDSTNTYSSGERKLDTYYMTSAAYDTWRNGEYYGDYDRLNTMFRQAIGEHFRQTFGNVGHVGNHQTHYNLVNFLMAGTDNCSKNLYYQYDPDSALIFLDGDDLDSILPTDNNGRQTKVYFLDRIHDVEDFENGYKPQIDYEGRASALFNAMEVAYEEVSDGFRQNMRRMLTAMASLVNVSEGYGEGVMGCIAKYFFATQMYFPAVAYAEQARIRYEWPKSFGFISSGNQARGIDPITQQVGSQLERERQYMRRRLAYLASYACWGDFSAGVNTGVVGLSDSSSALSLTPGSGRTGGEYAFDVTPHQWIYPVGVADRTVADPHVRVAPGETYRLVVAQPGQVTGDSSVGIAALNYYRKIGNLGNMVVGNNTLSVVANRLTEFIAEPTGQSAEIFAPGTISLNTPNLQVVSLRGAQALSGTLNFSQHRRLQSVDTRDTNISGILLPVSQTLTTLRLSATMTSLSLTGQPNLRTLTVQGVDRLTRLTMTGAPLLINSSCISLCNSLRTADADRASKTTEVRLSGIEWMDINLNLMQWLISVGDRGTCALTGSITMLDDGTGTSTLSYDEVVKLISRYGNIRSTANPLYVNYPVTAITAANLSISGPRSIKTSDIETIDGVDWWRKMFLTVLSGNNVAVTETSGGRVVPNVTWQFVEGDAATYAEFPDAYSPWMIVHLLQKNTARTVRVTLTTTTGQAVTIDAQITFWVRIPEVGDFAWTDGQFSHDDDPTKVMAGVVIMREVLERDEEDDIIAAKLWVLGTKTISQPTHNSWGLYPSSTQGLPSATGANADPLVAHIRTSLGLADTTSTPFDVPGLRNIYGNNMSIPNLPYKDITNDSPVIGATDASSGTVYLYNPVGDGTGYKQITQTDALMDFATEYENRVLLSYANRILSAVYSYWPSIHTQIEELGMQTGVDVDVNDIPLTLQAASDITALIIEEARNEGATDVDRYGELMYVAVRICSLWSPAEEASNALAEEDLDEQYRRGKWMLPSCGLLARVFNFLYNSREMSGRGPTINKSNEAQGVTITQEAALPIFANILYRSNSRRNFGLNYSNAYFSTTERSSGDVDCVDFYSGNLNSTTTTEKRGNDSVVPVAAYTFRV